MRFFTKMTLLGVVLALTPAARAEDGMTRVYFINDTPVPLTFHVEGRARFTCRTTASVPRCNLLTPSGYRTLVAKFDDGDVALTQSFDLPSGEPFLWTIREQK